jgi:hypothetical protein
VLSKDENKQTNKQKNNFGFAKYLVTNHTPPLASYCATCIGRARNFFSEPSPFETNKQFEMNFVINFKKYWRERTTNTRHKHSCIKCLEEFEKLLAFLFFFF